VTIPSGTKLGHYEVRSRIGAGAMGEVYLAQDTRLDRKVALKILPEEFAADAGRMRRFVLEAKSASALNHPNIITIYEIGEAAISPTVGEGVNFIVTEFIEGQTLNARGPLSLTAGLDVASQIASALQAAHTAGIIHRDIKPENVIIRPDGLVKILDFGIAKQSGPAVATIGLTSGTDQEAATAVKGGTSTGMIIGTASYMSPEQARGRAIDARTDIFSLGVVLYEMLAGRRPFAGENAMDVIGSIIADDPTPLTKLLPSLPPEIDRIINKTLKKKREERYQTTSELLVDLKSLQKRLEFEAELERTGSPDRDAEGKTLAIRAELQAQTEPRNSIAVMPFANMSNDPENEYFCDGLAEELLNALAKIDDLKVAARTSSFSFKGQNANVSTIGRALTVNTVLEGSVRKFGDRVRITVQLISAVDGYHLWSERYDRQIEDIFDVQDEITLAVVGALKVQLLGEEKEALLKRYTNNAEAYQLYLRGRFFFSKRTPESFRKAIAYFEQAIELDPAYALAQSGLADCYTFLGFYELVKPSDALDKVRAAAYKSVELDGNLAETRASVALFKLLYEWSFQGSLAEFEEAIRINPKYALVHHLHSGNLVVLDLNQEAIAAESRAAELEPFTAIFSASLGWWFYLGHRFEEAIAQSLRTIEIAPNHFFAHWILGITYGQTGKYEEAIEELQKAASLTEGNQAINADLARVYAQTGRHDEARKILDDLIAQSARHYISAVNLAKVFVGLGDKERALEFLEKAYEERAVRLPFFLPDPCVDELRNDPRFQSIRRRIGLPEDVTAQRPTKEVLEAHTAIFKSAEMHSDGENSAERQPHVPGTSAGPGAETTNSTLAPLSRMSRRNVLLFSLALFLLAGIGLGGYWFFGNHATKQIESIAVMPFVNESGNADVEYLSDGMTETLISSLSQLPNLNVKARSTVFRYKGKTTDAKTIGKELNVQAILNGRVVQRGDQLTLSLELVDAQTENVIWSERYNRKLTDLVTLHGEIAHDVSNELRVRLSGADEQKLAKNYTENAEAYQLYLKGLFHWNKRTPRDLQKSVEYFQQAVSIDPNYAPAFAGLADAYALLAAFGGASPREVMPKAKDAAFKAISLDNQLAEPHVALGHVAQFYDYDFVSAEREFKRAIELNPRYAVAHEFYGTLLSNLNRPDEADTEFRLALQLEPLALGANRMYGETLFFARRYDESIAQLKKTIELDDSFASAHRSLGRVYLLTKNYAGHVEEFARHYELVGEPQTAADMRQSFAKAGWQGFLRAMTGGKRPTKYFFPFYAAFYYVELGEKDKAIFELNKTYQDRLYYVAWMRTDPLLDPLRDDLRFQELLTKIGFPK
jgi:TolB-like protein/Tfp pilus assembly protein PilF